MQQKSVEIVGIEAAEDAIHRFQDVCGAAVVVTLPDAALALQTDRFPLTAKRAQGLCEQALAVTVAVDVGMVELPDSALQRRFQQPGDLCRAPLMQSPASENQAVIVFIGGLRHGGLLADTILIGVAGLGWK